MSHLVRRFHMDISKIIPLLCESFYSRFGLSLIIGIQTAVGSFYLNAVHLRSCGDAFQKIYGGDHHAFFVVDIFERSKDRLRSRSPEPKAVGRVQPLFLPPDVQGMVFQDLITSLLHVKKRFIVGKVFPDLSLKNIVGRRQFQHLPSVPHQTVTVACSCIETVGFVLQLPAYVPEKDRRVLRADLIGTVIQDGLLFIGRVLFCKSDKIAAVHHVCILHVHADAQRFQRGSPRIIPPGIVSHNRQVSGVASRSHSFRNSCHCPDLRDFRQRIHDRSFSTGKRRTSSQAFHRPVRHSVSQNHYIFHNNQLSSVISLSHGSS